MTVQTYTQTDDGGGAFTVDTDSPEFVQLDADWGCDHVWANIGRNDVARLHRQLGAWLGANPTGIVDRCPGSGQRPASMHKYGRTGACPVCGDQLHVTTRTGVIYKHRRRA